MKTLFKIFLPFLVLLVAYSVINASFIAKTTRISSDNSSFNSSLTVNNSGEVFYVKFTNIPSSGETSRDYKVRLSSSPSLN